MTLRELLAFAAFVTIPGAVMIVAGENLMAACWAAGSAAGFVAGWSWGRYQRKCKMRTEKVGGDV